MLPQLTVYAKIIYLLMVVISGALCTVEDYVIMSQCAHNKAIHLAAEGTVSVTDISKTQNITIVGLPDYINNDFKITLYAKETQRYLCFNENWKLVGMREIQETCYFNETIVHGYFVFRSVIDLQRRVGFTHRGKAIGPKKNVTDACYLFTKIHAEQFFHQHTQYYAPKTKTTTAMAATSTTTTATRATTTASAAAGTATATTNANKSKIIRNKYNYNNNNNKSKTNGMRNNNNSNSNTNQNRQNNQGHSSNISNTSNSNIINLSSIKEQLSVSNTTQQQQQQQRHHQVRHHHNDPNVVARRHQHEHKPKQKQRRQRMRARATASPTTTINTIVAAAAKTTTANQLNSQTTANRKTAPSNNSKAAKTTPSTTLATAIHVLPTRMHTATTTLTTTTMANKRKGRRRKGDRVHKKQQQKQQQQQLQQLPANAKDPQHRQANKALQLTAAEPTSAMRRLWTTTQTEEEDDSASAASSSSTADDYMLTSDWSAASLEPTAAATTAEYIAVSPTLTTLATSSTWPADFEASIATISVDNMAAASYATMLNNMLATAETAAASTSDAATRANDELYSSTLEAKSTAATTYNIANTWSADATMNEDYSTTSLDGEPTPMLSTQNAVDSKMLLALSTAEDNDEAATTTTVSDNSSSSSSSDFSSFATEQELLYNESTAETSTTNAEEQEDDIFTTSQAHLNSMQTSNVAENIIDTQNKVFAKPFYSSPTATYANISPTLATMMQHKLLRTTQRLDDAMLHEQTPLATDAAMSSSNTLDDSLTEYVFSTKGSNIQHKNHRNRQQNKKEHQQQQHATTSSSSSSSSLHRNLSLLGNKNKNAYNSKLNRNKLLSKASAGTTAATYLPTSALATFVTQNHRELLYADMLQEEQQQLANNNNHSLSNTNKNINNHQHNNTLFDYTSSVGFPLSDIAAATTVDAAAATAAAMPTASSTTTTTTKKHFRKSTQKLMATPFHQLTAYVRNHAGDIDIDNMDNISVYPDMLDVDVVHSNGSSESDISGNIMNNNNSRMTIVSGYLPTSATATLPESIRIAKIKINKERKRMLRQRFVGGGGGYA